MSPKQSKIVFIAMIFIIGLIWALAPIAIQVNESLATYKPLIVSESRNTETQHGSLHWVSIYSPNEKESILLQLKDYNVRWEHDVDPNHDSVVLTNKDTEARMSVSRQKTERTKQWKWFITMNTKNASTLLTVETNSEAIQKIADQLFDWK